MLTFGAVFCFAVLGLAAALEARNGCWTRSAPLLALSVASVVGCAALLYFVYDYNHLQAFATAAKLENPDGFLLFSNPTSFVMTRIEDVAELALFLSVPALALCVRGGLDLRNFAQAPTQFVLPILAITTLAVVLASGAYRTGETARAVIHIYPFLLLLLNKTDVEALRSATVLAGMQTVIMQTFGSYHW